MKPALSHAVTNRFVITLILALAASGIFAGETNVSSDHRVFVCAHSFMIFTARLLPPMAQAAHLPYASAGQQMIPASQVIQQWNLPEATNKCKTALREGRVDELLLSPFLPLPDKGIDNFTKLGLESNPNLRVLVQASWAAFDDQPKQLFKNEQRNAAILESLRQMRDHYGRTWLTKLEAQVRALNQSVGRDAVFIVPVDEAVFALRERIVKGTAPGLSKQTDLFRDDIGHPQPILAVLVTYCHFAAIYQCSPVGLPVPAELRNLPMAEKLNLFLQQLAWDAVVNYPMSGMNNKPATG